MVELPGIDSTVTVDVLINKPPQRRFLKILATPSPLAKLLEIKLAKTFSYFSPYNLKLKRSYYKSIIKMIKTKNKIFTI